MCLEGLQSVIDEALHKWSKLRSTGVCVLFPLKLSVDQSSRSCDLKNHMFTEEKKCLEVTQMNDWILVLVQKKQ